MSTQQEYLAARAQGKVTKEGLVWRQEQFDKLKEAINNPDMFRTHGAGSSEAQIRIRELVDAGLTAEEILDGVKRGVSHQQLMNEAVKMQQALKSGVTKVSEGVSGVLPQEAKKAVRNEKAAARMAETRQKATHNAQMASLENIAREQTGHYTPQSLSGMSSIELEDALIETLGSVGGTGPTQNMTKFVRSLKTQHKLNDEQYKEALIKWLAKAKGINLE
jgi:hypothetical protein